MTRTLGEARTIELLLECPWFSPQAAAEAGLVTRIVPAAGLLEEAQATAARLARRSPATVEAIKRAVYSEGTRGRLRADLAFESVAFLATSATDAAFQAMEAFLDELAEGEVTDENVLLDAWRHVRERSVQPGR